MAGDCERPGSINLRPIGIIHSPHLIANETPVQPVYARGATGSAEIYPEFADGLQDLEGFSHILLIYQFHKAGPHKLITKPFLEDTPHGVFATRSPSRPNPIGLSPVRLLRREGPVLFLDDLDVLDGTPLLDIKPHVGRFDHKDLVRSGWLDEIDDEEARRRGRRQWRGNPE